MVATHPTSSELRPHGSRLRTLLTAGGLVVASVLLTVLALVVADQVLHAKFDYFTANWRGYRGPVLGPKAPGELRVAAVGESTLYGFGAFPEFAIPAQLQQKLAPLVDSPVTVANLAYNNETAVCYASTLRQYADLQPDVVLIYSGYNDTAGTFRPESSCFRNVSPLFMATGYMPVLPLYLREKYYALRYGSVEEGYREEAKQISASQASAIQRLPGDAVAHYVGLITDLVQSQLALGRGVIFVTQPYISDGHRQQQEQLRIALQRFANDPRFRYVDLGTAMNLKESPLAYDGMHLTAEGNAFIASQLAGPMSEFLRALKTAPR
jgi:lysophospholipase L1-like esterase